MGGLAEVQGEELRDDGSLLGRRRNHRLAAAVHRYGAVSRKGLEERFFTLAFSGLVYPQIWEDPVVDLEAMALKPGVCLQPPRRMSLCWTCACPSPTGLN